MNFIIISSVNWTTHWQMHHQLSSSLADCNHNVLFIENTGARGPKINDISRIISRIRTRLKTLHGFKQVKERIITYSPIFLPAPYNNIAIFLNKVLIFRSIKRWMCSSNFTQPIVITFLPTPLTHGLIDNIQPDVLVYYCANHMAGASDFDKLLRSWEDKMFSRADIVFTISEAISNRAKLFSKHIYKIPAGVDAHLFLNELDPVQPPFNFKNNGTGIVGYVGGISKVFDTNLVIELANAIQDTEIIIIGPSYIDVSTLNNCKNITLLGKVSHSEVASYISIFDVAIIPYKINDFTNSVYTCKLTEYLSLGKYVVSTGMAEVFNFSEEHPGVIEISKNPRDFISKVKNGLENKQVQSELMRIKRISVAKENTWDVRFSLIMDTINHYASKSSEKFKSNSWKGNLYRHYKAIHLVRAKYVVLFSAIYLSIFYTPLFWFLGEQLVSRDAPLPSDAIVVFSGDGDVSYNNTSYQRRAIDAIQLYKHGYATKIFLSSGREQTIPEIKMIRLFLTDHDIPEEYIFTLDRYPSSTFENVVLVNKELKKNNINSILFITSPYHSYRSKLLWNKQNPDMKLVTPAVIDTPSAGVTWTLSIDEIRVIVYEYFAIVYNRLRGWL